MAKQLNKSVAGRNEINFNVGFNVDKANLNNIRTSLSELSKMTASNLMDLDKNLNTQQANANLQELRRTVTSVQQALTNSFNQNLGTVNVTKFNTELSKTGLNLKNVANTFRSAGIQGESAFRSLATEVLTTNKQIKQTHHLLQDMANTMANTVKWSIASSVMNNFSGSVQKAYGFVKKLDTSLNNIRIVTGKSADEMDRFAKQANKAAKELSAQTTTYTDAALIYYQQGLGDEEANARAATTVKASNVTGMSGSDTSEALTAVWNGYKVSAKETELYVDKLAKVAAGTAADLEELSTGMSKVASAANVAGVDIDQLNGILATVISVTREAPETIGSSFKTIFARLGDLKLNGEDEYGVSLGNVSGKLHELGIEILDEKGEMRDMGTIIEETAAKWDTWTRAQKQAAAVAMAGKMQYSRLITLFENWDMYTDSVNMSKTAMGELQKEQDIYAESVEGHLAKMNASMEGLYSSLLDEDTIIGFSDAITFVINRVTDLVDGLGGGGNVLLALGATGVKVFDKQIASSLATTVTNIRAMNSNLKQTSAEMALLQQFEGIQNISDSGYKQILDMKKELLSYGDSLTEQEEKDANAAIRRYNDLLKEKDAIIASQKEAEKYLGILSETENGSSIKETDNFKIGEDGKASVNFQNEGEDFFGDNTDAVNAFTEALDKESQSIEKVEKDIANYRKQIKTVNDLHNTATKRVETEAKAENMLSDSLDEVENSINDLVKDLRLEDSTRKHLKETVDEYNEAVSRGIDPTAATNLASDLVDAYEGAVNEIKAKTEQTKQTVTDAANGVGRVAFENADLAWKAWNKATSTMKLEMQIKSMLDLASGIGQVTAGLSAIINMGDIFSDDTLSDGEKFLKITEGLAIALPMLFSGFTSITKTLPQLAAQFGLITLSETGVATAANGAAMSATAMWTAILWPIAAVVAGLAIVGLGIWALVKAWNADADAAKEANEHAKEAAEIADEAKQAYQNLLDTLDRYKSATDNLKELKQGTEEYRDALREANDAAMELIKIDSELAKNAKRRNGLIVFEKEDGTEMTQEEIASRTKARMHSAEGAANVAQAEANEKFLKSQRTTFLRDSNLDLGQKAATTYAASVLNPAMAPLTAAVNRFDMALSDSELESVIEHLAKAQEEGTLRVSEGGDALRNSLKELSFLNDAEIDALVNNSSKLGELVTSTDQLNETNKLLLQSSLEDSLEGNSRYAKLSDAEKAAVSSRYGQGLDKADEDKLRREAENDWNKDAAFGKGNEDDVHEAYAKARGWTLAHDKIGDTAVYTDKEGEEHKVEDDTARAYLINRQVQDNLKDYDKNSLNSIMDAVQSVDADEIGKKYGADFKTALLNTVANGGQKIDTATLFADLSPSEVAELNGMTADQWKESLGLTDEEFKTLGLGSGQEFAENFQKALTEYDWDPAAAVKSATSKMEVSPKDLGLDEEEFQGFAEHLMNIADNDDELADSLEEDADAATILTKQIMRMNKGIDALSEGQEEWIDILKNSSRSSEEYYEALSSMQKALADVLDTEEDYISETFVKEHLEDIQKAAEGDAEAIDRLHKALAVDMVAHIAVDNDLDQNKVQELINQVQGLEIPEIKVGSSIDFTKFDADTKEFLDKMLAIVENSKMTADQANEFFGQMGFEPNFETKPEKITDEVPVTVTESEITSVFPLRMKSRSYQDGTEPVTRTIEVPKLSSSSKNSYKGIKGITKKATGSYNNYSKKNSGGSGPKGSSGSGGSKSEPSKKDLNEDKVDRYEKVNVQLEKINARLDKIKSQEDKLIGQALLDNLNSQLQELNNKLDKTNDKLRIARGEQAELQNQLRGYGIGFDAEGVMTNYAQVFAQQQAALNAVYMRYNSMSADAQKNYEATVEAAEKRWEEFKEAVTDYDSLIGNTIPGLEKDLQDAIDEQIEIQIKEFDMEIEIALDIKAAEEQWAEFKRKVIDQIKDDDILGNAEASLLRFAEYYNEAGNGIVQEQTKYLNNLMAEINKIAEFGSSDVYGDNMAHAMEDLQTYYESAMESLEEVVDLVDEIKQSLIDTFDEVADKMGEQLEYYDAVTSTLEHDMELVKLIYGEEAYNSLAEYYEKQEQNLNSQLDFQRQQVEFWKAQMDVLDKGSDEWKAAKEQWMDAVSEWQAKVEEAIETLQDKYLNAINAIFQALNKQVTGGLGLGYVEQEWELINKHADSYLDTVNATYGIQQLQNKYLQAIEDTDSIPAQRKLRDLMNEQVEALKAQDRLTEYDLKRAELKYQIALKQIALEEAQQNKSTMRLRRDSQGNYRYQYVADDDQVSKLQEEISNLYNELYNLDTERYRGNLDELYNIWVEYQEKLAEAAQINDPEARLQREQLLEQQYGDLINGIVAQNELIKQNLHESTYLELEDLYGRQSEMVQQFLADEDEMLGLLVDGWRSALQDMADAINEEGGFAPTYEQALNDINDATNEYESSLGALQDTAGVVYDDLAQGIDPVVTETEELIDDNTTLISTFNEEVDAIKAVIDQLTTLEGKYNGMAEAAKKATTEAYNLWKEQERQAQEAAAKEAAKKAAEAAKNNPAPATSGGGNGGGGDGKISVGDTVTYLGGGYTADSYGGGAVGNRGPGGKAQITQYIPGRPRPIHLKSSNSAYGWVRQDQISGYDTGGYTGDWNSNDGRMAILHQKELVLNKEDTANLLDAVEIMRSITNALGNSVWSQMANIVSNGTVFGKDTETLEQDVHIEANFPNVTSSHEIEDAINNLVNVASQRIRR